MQGLRMDSLMLCFRLQVRLAAEAFKEHLRQEERRTTRAIHLACMMRLVQGNAPPRGASRSTVRA